jgi:hypothetical protein
VRQEGGKKGNLGGYVIAQAQAKFAAAFGLEMKEVELHAAKAAMKAPKGPSLSPSALLISVDAGQPYCPSSPWSACLCSSVRAHEGPQGSDSFPLCPALRWPVAVLKMPMQLVQHIPILPCMSRAHQCGLYLQHTNACILHACCGDGL